MNLKSVREIKVIENRNCILEWTDTSERDHAVNIKDAGVYVMKTELGTLKKRESSGIIVEVIKGKIY